MVVFLTPLCGMPAVSAVAESATVPTRLLPCPDSPNCVSSDAIDPSHRVLHFSVILPINEAWRLVEEAVKDMPRTKIVEITDNYLHAACTRAVFRFVDDLELELRPGDGIIAVRSASRIGHSDFGVNRSRVEHFRKMLRAKGAIQ